MIGVSPSVLAPTHVRWISPLCPHHYFGADRSTVATLWFVDDIEAALKVAACTLCHGSQWLAREAFSEPPVNHRSFKTIMIGDCRLVVIQSTNWKR
jgi:hypothetical protein